MPVFLHSYRGNGEEGRVEEIAALAGGGQITLMNWNLMQNMKRPIMDGTLSGLFFKKKKKM